MKNYIPTIEELSSKPERELSAIFRMASAMASDVTQDQAARRAASTTVENVRRCRISQSHP